MSAAGWLRWIDDDGVLAAPNHDRVAPSPSIGYRCMLVPIGGSGRLLRWRRVMRRLKTVARRACT